MTGPESNEQLAERLGIDVEIINELERNGGVLTPELWNRVADCFNREHGGDENET